MRGPDSCGAPDLYTIDKRCYVTDYQKTQSPYNAVVRVAAMGGGWGCTGTIVQNGGDYYVYTAAHCVKSEKDNSVAEYIMIELQDGRYFLAKKNSVGDYDVVNRENNHGSQGDWAFYRIVNTPRDVLDNGTNFVRGDARVQLRVYRYSDYNELGFGDLDGKNQMFLPNKLKSNGKYPDKIYVEVCLGNDEAGSPVYYPFLYEFASEVNNRGGYQLVKMADLSSVSTANGFFYLLPPERDGYGISINQNLKVVPTGALKVRSVGYGALKILSDQEIKDVMSAYILWLKGKTAYRDDMTDEQKSLYGVKAFGGEVEGISLYPGDDLPRRFIVESIYNSWFNDFDRLKESNCYYYDQSLGPFFLKCQVWGGNSGGPVFDSNNNLIAIQSSGLYFFSTFGPLHIESDGAATQKRVWIGGNSFGWGSSGLVE